MGKEGKREKEKKAGKVDGEKRGDAMVILYIQKIVKCVFFCYNTKSGLVKK